MRNSAHFLLPMLIAVAACHGAGDIADDGGYSDFEERFPAWSPDGSRVAFVSDREQPGVFHLFVANIDGSGLTALTSGNLTAEWPSWSHDGAFLYFDSRREKKIEIFKIPSAGGQETQVTGSGEGSENVSDAHAALSPKGDNAAFDSNREADGLRKIYTMAPDGTKVRLVTINPHSNSFPSWSPDGSLIAFRMRKSTFSPVSEIHVIKPDGTGLRMVTKLGAACTHPSWSPDGTQIVFAVVLEGNHEICVASADGVTVERITETKRNELRPTFSPDGTEILFCADEGGRFGIYRMKADGTDVRRITFVTGEHVPETQPTP